MRCRRRRQAARATPRAVRAVLVRCASQLARELRATLRTFGLDDTICVHQPKVKHRSDSTGDESDLPVNTVYVRISERNIKLNLGFLALIPAGEVRFILFVREGREHSVFKITPSQEVRTTLEMTIVLHSALRRTPFQAIVAILSIAATYELTSYHEGVEDPEFWHLLVPSK